MTNQPPSAGPLRCAEGRKLVEALMKSHQSAADRSDRSYSHQMEYVRGQLHSRDALFAFLADYDATVQRLAVVEKAVRTLLPSLENMVSEARFAQGQWEDNARRTSASGKADAQRMVDFMGDKANAATALIQLCKGATS